MNLTEQRQIGDEVDELVEGPSSQGIAKAGTGFINASIDWAIIDWLRGVTQLPLVIKGVQSVEDAVIGVQIQRSPTKNRVLTNKHIAYQHGVQGIVVSNHGGRSMDT